MAVPRRFVRPVVSLFALLLGISACGDDNSVAPQAVTSVQVTPGALNLRPGQSMPLTATVQTQNGAASTVTWSSAAIGVATVSESGVVTAVAPGTVVISALSTFDPVKRGSATVVVTAAEVLSVQVVPSTATMFVGEALTLVPVVTAQEGASTAVNWANSNPSIATITPLQNGQLSIAATAQGTTVITATSAADPTKNATATITIMSGSPPSGVQSVVVSPATATTRIPNTVTFAAQVTVTSGVSTAVTWSSSNVGIATVNPTTGVVTPVSPGVVAIMATSVADPGKKSAASLTVQPALTSASVSIPVIYAGGTSVPVNPLAVAGQIDAVITVDPGEVSVQLLELLVDDVVVASKTVSITPGLSAEAAQNVLSYNTARYAIAGSPALTGGTTCRTAGNPQPTPQGHACVDFVNGPHKISARAITTGAGAGVAESDEVPVSFMNVSGFHMLSTPPTHSATGTNGQTWYGGPAGPEFNIATWPVRYDNRRITSVVICSPSTTGVAVNAGTLFPLGSAPSPVPAATCLSDDSTPFSVNIIVPLSNNAGVPAAFGFVNSALSVSSDGGDGLPVAAAAVNLANGQAMLNQQSPINIDNMGPTFSQWLYTPTAPASSMWVNASYSFLAGMVPPVDPGVGTAASTNAALYAAGDLKLDWTPTCSFGAFTAGSWVAFSGSVPTGAQISESTCNQGNTAFNARARASDILGNVSPNFAFNSSTPFGVDKTPPGLRFSSGAAPSSLPATVDNFFNPPSGAFTAGTHFRAEFFDARSGFGAAPQQHFLAAASMLLPTGVCGVGGIGSGSPGASFLTAPSCSNSVAPAPGAPLADGWLPGAPVDVGIASGNAFGYFVYSTLAVDVAGNAAVPITRSIVFGGASPALFGVTVPTSISGAAGNGASNAFTSSSTDDVEVNDGTLRIAYPNLPGAAGDTLAFPRTTLAARFDNTTTSVALLQHVQPYSGPFVRGLEAVAADSTLPGAPGVGSKPTHANVRVFDVAGRVSSNMGVAIPGGNVESGISYSTWNASNPSAAITQWYVRAGIGPVPPFLSTSSLRAEVKAPLATTNSPFVRVDFYRLTAGMEYQYLGSSSTAIETSNGANRFWTYVIPTTSSLANTPALLTPQSAVVATNSIIAIGVSSAGDGIVTTLCGITNLEGSCGAVILP